MPLLEKTELEIKPGCEKCTNGFIRRPIQPLGFESEVCSCLVEYENIKWAHQAQKLSRLPAIDLEQWEQNKILDFELLSDFANSNQWLFLNGNTGTGKTYSSVIIGYMALLKERSVYFSSVAELLDNLRPNEFDKVLRDKTKHNCKVAEVLILDDIGQEKKSDWVREQLHLIIDYRYNQKKQTIFTSNFPVERLRETTSEAIYSRVKGTSQDFRLESRDRRINK